MAEHEPIYPIYIKVVCHTIKSGELACLHSDSYVLLFVSCSMVLHRCHIKFIIETIEESFFKEGIPC